MRPARGVIVAALAVLVGQGAYAAPTFLVSPPGVDAESGEMVFLVGGISEEGSTLKPTSVEVEIDGAPGPAPKSVEAFSEYAQAASEASQAWKSPLAAGLVYLWVKDVPAGFSDAILEGLGGFLRRIPGRSNVYVTFYGRKRQPIPKLRASEVGGQLHDFGYIPGDRPNLADAIRVDLKALLGDESRFKVMVVVTDGRDYNDSSGEAADFAAVADEIEKAGVKLMVVSFPSSDIDTERITKNLSDLTSAGSFRRATEQPIEIQSTLESLGQSIADLRRVRLEIPWAWRNLGGTHKVRLNVMVDGKRRAIEVGKVTVQARMSWLLIPIGILIGLLAIAAVVILVLRGRRGTAEPDLDEDESQVLAAAHALIQRGLPAQRALVELTRAYPDDVGTLANLDASVFSDERYPIFRTKAGRRRLEELVALLSRKATDDSLLGADLAEVLSQSISNQSPPDQAASNIAARVPEDQRSAFARLGLDELAKALRVLGSRYPTLASPRARGVALEIQAALRNEDHTSNSSLAVGWLVRATGAGKRGETLRWSGPRVVVGCGSACQIRLDGDPQVAEQHAAITERRGAFYIEPVAGAIKVETKPVTSRQPLGDGDTIELGQGRYVFKCVSAGHVSHSRSGA